MKKILFICQWNIWRSQIAEWFAKKIWDMNIEISSAGIDNVWFKYNHKPYPPIIEILKNEYNIDISQQTVKHVTEEMIDAVDSVIILCKEKECQSWFPTYLGKKSHIILKATTDPNNKTETDIKEIIEKIKYIVHDVFIELDPPQQNSPQHPQSPNT